MFHFLNCMLLTFGPHVILYRSTKLAEENAIKSCAWAGAGYAITQIVKIFVMATFLPATTDGWNTTQELMKTGVNILELVGIHITLERIPNLSKFSHGSRILCVGLGWSFAEALALYAIPLWLGARSMEFSWEYITMGICSNVDMLLNMSILAAMWLWSRTDLESRGQPLVLLCLVVQTVLPSTVSYMTEIGMPVWNIQGVRLALGLILGVPMRILIERYATHKMHKAVKAKVM